MLREKAPNFYIMPSIKHFIWSHLVEFWSQPFCEAGTIIIPIYSWENRGRARINARSSTISSLLQHNWYITEQLEPNGNLWFSCLLMLKYHCKKHWVNAETTLGRTGRHANAQNAYLHTTRSSATHLGSPRVWWATPPTSGTSDFPPISCTWQLPESCTTSKAHFHEQTPGLFQGKVFIVTFMYFSAI